MNTVETIEEVIKTGSCNLTSFEKIEEISKPKVSIDGAYLLIYNWPDDPSGANTTIHVDLTYLFIHNDQEYKAITRTKFYDFDVAKFENLPKKYFITEYHKLVEQALILSKQKIEEKLEEPLSSVIPFNFNRQDSILLAINAGYSRQIDYV